MFSLTLKTVHVALVLLSPFCVSFFLGCLEEGPSPYRDLSNVPSDVLGGEGGDEKEEREEKPGSSLAGREEKTVSSLLIHALHLAVLTCP